MKLNFYKNDDDIVFTNRGQDDTLWGRVTACVGAGPLLDCTLDDYGPAAPAEPQAGEVISGFSFAAGAAQMDTLHWVNKAASHNECKPYIVGTYLENDIAVATDGHRLHTAPFPCDLGGMPNVLLPPDAFHVFTRLAMQFGGEHTFNISFTQTHIIFRIPSCFKIIAKRPQFREFSYPNYQKVIPTDIVPAGGVYPKAIMQILRTDFGGQEEGPPRYDARVDTQGQITHLNGQPSMLAEKHADTYMRPPCDFGINLRYLHEAAQGLPFNEMFLASAPDGPQPMQPITLKSGERMAIIMPCRLP